MEIKPVALKGKIHPPPSKSISHRALIFAAIGKPGSRISNILKSEDVRATKEGLERMGAVFLAQNDGYELQSGVYQGSKLLNCLNSGTTLRLLTGIASLFPQRTMLLGDSSLNSRPMGPLVNALQKLGAEIKTNDGKPPIEIISPVKSYELETEIEGDVSSQFISSLLIMSAVRGEGISTRINLIKPVVSKPYIDLTIQMLNQVGVDIRHLESGFEIDGRIDLGKVDIAVPADFSSAAFMIVAGAIPGNEVTIEVVFSDYTQADEKILEFVKEAGAVIEQNGRTITIRGNYLKAIEADISQCPDLFPILCVLAAMAEGRSKFYNAKHLRVKETDRIATMVHNLQKAGIDVEELEDGAYVKGGTVNGGITLNSFHDHRIAMACAILATQAQGPVQIENADCVSVSYPSFFEDLKSLMI